MAFKERPDSELNRLSDEELVAYAVAARDAGRNDAMQRGLAILIFRRYDDLVRRARMKVPPNDAEDIAAQTISDAVIANFRGESVGEFMKLVSTILKRRIADFHEKMKHTIDTKPLPEENQGDEDVHAKPAGIEADETDRIGVQDVIDRLLEALSASHRRVVELYGLDGWSAEETADAVNKDFSDLDTRMSVDNVHKIASRFRKDLRDELEDSG